MVNDGLLAVVFWVAAVLLWYLLATESRKSDLKAVLWATLPAALFSTGFAIFLTVRAVLS